MLKQKKIIAMLAPVGLVMGMTMATQAVAMSHGDSKYASDISKGMVKNSGGECWRTAGGTSGPQPACGDEMPVKPMMMGPKDSDGDGVMDADDRCPGTRAGAKVDSSGCEVVENLTVNLVEDEFDFDSAALKPAMEDALDELAARIKASKGHEQLTITGHTDSVGSEGYNMGLSERRAQAAAAYLEASGIDSISTNGMGESSPVGDNGTAEGRAQNRRVEIKTY
ncbi:MAG: OmpA family protein [Gammaproteobacteria bacterium]|nr:OmpA family protein [Gammaproteobacteria bacterium]